MWDEKIAAKAGEQFNRLSLEQLEALGCSEKLIRHRIDAGRLVVVVETGVLAVAPVLDDPWGCWMGATLTAPETYLSHWSAGRAHGFLDWERPWVTVTRRGNGGPRRHGGVMAYRRLTLDEEVGLLRNVLPITSPERTLLVFKDAGYEIPVLNEDVADEEADLHWEKYRLIDLGGDRWEVRRISSDDVHERPHRLLGPVPEAAPKAVAA